MTEIEASGFLADTCPVCRQQTRQVVIERVNIERRGHAVGSAPMLVSETVTGVDFEVTFACDLVRTRRVVDGRLSAWQYDEKRECKNAQRVVLDMREAPQTKEDENADG